MMTINRQCRKTLRRAFVAALTLPALFSAPLAARAHDPLPVKAQSKGAIDAATTYVTLKLMGLHCEGCEMSVKTGLMSVSGVASAEVRAKTQTAVVGLRGKKPATTEALKAAVKKAGYSVVAVAQGKPKG